MEDERQVELDCISAIFPEIVLDPEKPFIASIDLLVHPRNPVKVHFPVSVDGVIQTTFPTPPRSAASGREDGQVAADLTNGVECHSLSYLPPLRLHITLPDGYPATCAPKFELSTTPAWLSRKDLDGLEAHGDQMWEEADHSEIVYGYIDSLQQAAENAFGYGEGEGLEIPSSHKIALLDYDIKARQIAFDKETFDCGICLGKASDVMVCDLTNSNQIRKRDWFATRCSTVGMSSVSNACKNFTTMLSTRVIWCRFDVLHLIAPKSVQRHTR